jgi:hypothetical protein
MTNVSESKPLVEALDLGRFAELHHHAELGTNLWESLRLAAERGDAPNVRSLMKQIAAVTRASIELVKLLGQDDGSNG